MCIWVEDWRNQYAIFQRKLAEYDRICVLGSIEAEPNKIGGSEGYMQTFLSLCEAYGRDVTILTAAHPDDKHLFHFPKTKNNVNVIYWPTFWLTLSLVRLINGEPLQVNTQNEFDIYNNNVGFKYDPNYTFISMNGVPKEHRCILQDLLVKHDILKYGKFSWRNIRNEGHWYDFKYWKEEKTLLDQNEPGMLFHQEVLPPVYNNCFMQLVPETHEDRFFLTEKTTMPLFFNKPFLVAGSVGFHKKLQGLGFMIYDEIFDYSFDSEPNLEKRFEMLVEVIKSFTVLNKNQQNELYKKIFDKCVYNRKLALKYAMDINSFPTIWNELDDSKYDHLQHVNPHHINRVLNNKKNEFRL